MWTKTEKDIKVQLNTGLDTGVVGQGRLKPLSHVGCRKVLVRLVLLYLCIVELGDCRPLGRITYVKCTAKPGSAVFIDILLASTRSYRFRYTDTRTYVNIAQYV